MTGTNHLDSVFDYYFRWCKYELKEMNLIEVPKRAMASINKDVENINSIDEMSSIYQSYRVSKRQGRQRSKGMNQIQDFEEARDLAQKIGFKGALFAGDQTSLILHKNKAPTPLIPPENIITDFSQLSKILLFS